MFGSSDRRGSERVVAGETCKEVFRGLRAAQAGPLRQHGIDPRGVVIGGSTGMRRRHGASLTLDRVIGFG
jgi:hypothetical protein